MSSTRVANFDSDEVAVSVGGIPIDDMRALEEFLTIDAEGDAYEDESGSDGGVTRYATHETRYTATLKLKGASKCNAKLAALHALDTNAPNGAGIGTFMVKDNNGSSLYASPTCWIVKAPAAGFGKKRGDCEWKIRVVAKPSTMITGGN